MGLRVRRGTAHNRKYLATAQFRVHGSMTMGHGRSFLQFFFSATPRRLRRPGHPNQFLLELSSKLTPWQIFLFLPASFSFKARRTVQGRAGGPGQRGATVPIGWLVEWSAFRDRFPGASAPPTRSSGD